MTDTNANSVEIIVTNMEALREVTPDFDGQYFRTHYYIAAGFGGGLYQYDARDNSSEDDGGDVIVTGSGSRLRRQWEQTPKGSVLAWGLDPTGNQANGDYNTERMQALADRAYNTQSLTRTIVFPSEGVFIFGDQPVNLHGRLTVMSEGQRWSHFGQGTGHTDIRKKDNADGGAIFTNGYNFFNLTFSNPRKRKAGEVYHGVELAGYVNKIERCSFHGLDDAMHCKFGVNIDIVRCHFTTCTRCLGSDNDNIYTTINMESNLCQYCDHLFYTPGELWGSRFQGNTWEVCNDSLVVAKTIFNCSFITNWIEQGGDASAPKNPIRTLSSQQIKQITLFGNSFHFSKGWNRFDEGVEGTISGKIGGVSFDQGHLLTAEATGSGMRLTPDGLYQEMDPWKPSKPLLIKAAKNKYGGMPLLLDAQSSIYIRTTNKSIYLQSGEDEASSVSLYWPRRVNVDAGTDANMRLYPDRIGLPRIELPFRKTNPSASSDTPEKERYSIGTASVGTPLMLRWSGAFTRGNGNPEDHGYFDYSEVQKDHVTLASDHIETRAPKIIVQVENDPDIEFESWQPLSSYSGSWGAYRAARGFRFFFRNKDTKERVIPSSFIIFIQNGW